MATSVEVSCPQRTCKHDPPLAVTLRYVLEADLAAGRGDAAVDPLDFLRAGGVCSCNLAFGAALGV